LGFAILPELQGKGIITEAAKATLKQYEGKQVFGITSKQDIATST
jgi:RimJ/RimL family protein N-acetyltransferase